MEDIIKTLNKFVANTYNTEGRFIHNISYKVNSNFKAYRNYSLELYYTLNGKTIPIIQEGITEKYTEENKNLVETKVKLKFLELLFDLVASDEFKDLMYGRVNF